MAALPRQASLKPARSLTLSISVTKGDNGCTITLISNVATWTLKRSYDELMELDTTLRSKNENRGIYLPPLPNNNMLSSSSEYQEYLSKIVCRIFWVHYVEVLEFIQAPLQFRKSVKQKFENEKSIIIKCGRLKKEGEKNKSYSKRYFVVLSNHIIQYWDNLQSFKENKNGKKSKQPKGNIDLLMVNAIITKNINKKYTFHLSTPDRIWKIQCKSDNEKNEWTQFLNQYLTSIDYQPFIAPHRPQNTLPAPNTMDDDIKELFLSRNANQCHRTKTCDTISRISYILLYHYQLMKAMDYNDYNDHNDHNKDYNDDNDEKYDNDDSSQMILYNYINQHLYPYNGIRLTNDYLHLLTKHKHEFNTLYDKVTNEIGTHCDIQMCSSFKRIETNAIKSKDNKYNILSHKEMDIFHLCDVIHCYFLHSYDLGMQLSDKQLTKIQNKMDNKMDNNMDNNNDDDKSSDADVQFKIMRQELSVKKESLHKYLTFVQTHYDVNNNNNNKKNKFITWSNSEILETHDTNTKFGYKYFYWKYYKDNDELDLQYNVGYKISDFYVEARYKDVKTEIMHNSTFSIDCKKWDYLLRKALSLLRCDIIKGMKCNNNPIEDNFDLNIKPGNIISVNYVLSILIYTNIIMLQRLLSSTYYPLNNKESLNSMKKRHAKFGNWAKYLFETIHCFGNSINKDKLFYHGIDSMTYFTNNQIDFNHPISVSGSIVVITTYSINNEKNNNDGIILRLIKSDTLDERDKLFKLHCFNCSIFSDFSFEDEYLFNGSWNGLQIDSIYDLSVNRKYRSHLRALRTLDLMFKGLWLNTSLPPTSRKIISMLFTNELKYWLGIDDKTIILQENIYKLPEYVELSFHCFTHKLKSLVLDVASFMKQKHTFNDTDYFGYSWLRKFIIYQKFYFINLDIIIPLFPKCQTLTILNSVSMGPSSLKFELNDRIFKCFIKLFKKYNNSTELRQIQMSGFDTPTIKIKKLVQNYQEIFHKQLKWHLQCIDIESTNQVLVVMQCLSNN